MSAFGEKERADAGFRSLDVYDQFEFGRRGRTKCARSVHSMVPVRHITLFGKRAYVAIARNFPGTFGISMSTSSIETLSPGSIRTRMRSGSITTWRPMAVVSRKQNRVFVRQGFVPLFDLPLTIAAPDRPLGTHVFTAMALKDDGATMRWTVVSIPSGYSHQTDHAGKRAKKTSNDRREMPVAGSAPQEVSTAAAALDRITLPPEAIEQISALLSPGASLIVSDNALSDETDIDTDFVVLTR
jgi:hypothetical protein